MANLSDLKSAQTVKLAGANASGVEQEFIGSSNRRLWVDSLNSPVPLSNVIYQVHRVVTPGNSDDLRQNGSVTPVNCTWSPGVGTTWYIEDLRFLIIDSGTTSSTNFGALAALTNGVEIQIRSQGITTTLTTLKTNIEIAMFFKESPLITPTAGFFETSDAYVGQITFDKPIIVQNSKADFVRLIVKDNLTALDQLKLFVKAWRVQ